MSISLTLFYRHAIFRPLDMVRRRVRGDSARVVAQRESAHDSPAPRCDAEHFERIATYACAGYFNMGYTLEVFHVSD